MPGGRPIVVSPRRHLDLELHLQHNSPRHALGIAEPQNRVTKAARRTAATGFLLYGLVVWWRETVRPKPANSLRDWSGKCGASSADMLAALRLECLKTTAQTSFPTPAPDPAVTKLLNRLMILLTLAA